MRGISHLILWLEAATLAIITVVVVAAMIFFRLANFFSPVEVLPQDYAIIAVAYMFVAIGLTAGWRPLLVHLVKGRTAAKQLSSWWWRAAYTMAAVSVAACIFWLYVPSSFVAILLAAGLGYVPTLLHLSAEVWL
jgi:hypothetical protein